MNIIKGIDRIALILAIISTIPGFVISLEIFKPSPKWGLIIGIVGSSIAFLIVLFTIRGMARFFLWLIDVFRGEIMKERLLDVIKWGLVLIIAGAIFYIVCPKYQFSAQSSGLAVYRYNKITGSWKIRVIRGKKWIAPELKTN